MKLFFKHNGIYLTLYFALLAYLASVLLNDGKVQIHQQINTHVGNHYLDVFFKYITHLGDGIFVVLVGIMMLFFNLKKASYILLTYISASILTTILKTFVFVENWRPLFVYRYFATQYNLNTIEGVDLNVGNSFPSGHATAAFALFMSLVFMSNKQVYKMLFFILAVLATFSRTYLSQHWLVDIYFGSIIGFCFSVFFYVVFYNKSFSEKYALPLQIFLAKKKNAV